MKTNQEILETAIQKAIEGGYNPAWKNRFDLEGGTLMVGSHYDDEIPIFEVIFNHDFARALWPNPPVISHKDREKLDKGELVEVKPYPFELQWWQWNLMQMVIADDPIAYLGAHL